jgi:hypothetical protein
MSDAPQRKAASPAPEGRDEFDASYNELPAPNPLFTEYSQSQGAPTGASDSVNLPRSTGDTVVVDGRVVSGHGDGQIVINHANVVNIYRGDRSAQEARYEQISGNVFDGQYSEYQGPPHSTIRGHRPLYGQDAVDAFYAHRGPEHMPGRGRTRAWSYADAPPPVYRDSVIAGGPQGVVFRDTTSGYGPDGVVIQDRGVSGRDIMATTVALANSDLARILIDRHGGNDRGRGYDFYRRGVPMVDFRYDTGYPGTPPFVPGGYESSTVYGGPGGVVFQDSGYDYPQRNNDLRDIAAFGVALANSPLVGLLDRDRGRSRGGSRGDDCFSGGRNNYYNQNLARERFANNYRNNQLRISMRLSA